MKIIIPTKGRISNQLTIANLPEELRKNTVLVCPEKERFWHSQKQSFVTVIAQPDPDMGIADKRKWIMEQSRNEWNYEKIVMLDDDLRLAIRRIDDPGLFRKAGPEDIIKAFRELEEILSPEIPHAGFAVRGSGIGDAAKQGGWQVTGKRAMYSLAYHVSTVLDNAEFGRIGTHEDIDITLQLLRKGFPNAINFSFVTDQAFGKPGGCSDERTVEKNNVDVLKLAELHPGYVRVTEKMYKVSTPRLEVVCAWQKALKDGLLNRK